MRHANPVARASFKLTVVATACLAAIRCAHGEHFADGDVAGEMVVLNDNGAWSWFEDERAIVDASAGKLLVSSVANRSGRGPARRHGNVELAVLDLATGKVKTPITLSTLSDTPIADDHNSAALLIRPDGRYLAAYAQHNVDSLMRYRVSTLPGDPSRWEPEQTVDNGAGTTYSNLLRLSAEGNKIYNFTRTENLDPHWLASSDQGRTWSKGGRLLQWTKPVGDPKFTGHDGSRPYVKYASNGVDEIHFIASEDHPRAYDNSLYHGVVRGGKAYDSTGRVVDADLADDAAMQPCDYAAAFDTDASPLGYAWPTDLALDSQGRPYAVFTVRADGDNANDHRFLYARFNGTQWHVHEMARAGGYLYASEPDYTGLAALDPSRPDRVFISTNVDPRTGSRLRRYEIFEGITPNGGAQWTWRPITSNSQVDNLRPVVPKWDAERTALVWMRGTYRSFKDFDVAIVALTAMQPPANEGQGRLRSTTHLRSAVVTAGGSSR